MQFINERNQLQQLIDVIKNGQSKIQVSDELRKVKLRWESEGKTVKIIDCVEKIIQLFQDENKDYILIQPEAIQIIEELEILLAGEESIKSKIFDVVIITVTDNEYNAFYHPSLGFEWNELNNEDRNLKDVFVGCRAKKMVFQGYKILLLKQWKMGMVEAAVLTEKVIHEVHPSYIFSSGIAASIDKEHVKILDIVITEESWDYGNGKIEGESIDTENFYHSASHILASGFISKMKDEKVALRDNSLKYLNQYYSNDNDIFSRIHFSKMVSGAAVVKNETVKKIIKNQSRDVAALDMETYGFYYTVNRYNSVAQNDHIEYLTVKTIVDYADINKSDEYQKVASYLSACTIKKIIETCAEDN